jgi:hypothetical protein
MQHKFCNSLSLSLRTSSVPEEKPHMRGSFFKWKMQLTRGARTISQCTCHLHAGRGPGKQHEAPPCNSLALLNLVTYTFLAAVSDTFNSLFKVLFIFPSWYLCTIGLEPLFSFGWNLPPHLRSSPEERDFKRAHHAQRIAHASQDSHLQRHSFPRGLQAHLCWQCLHKQHIKAAGP